MSNQNWIMPFDISNDFVFNPSPRDFIVEELPLYEFTGEGEHLILKIRKKSLTTWEMLDILSNHIGVSKREIGYAGLKDKNALTTQYISMPKKYQEKLESFEHKGIKILETTYHKNRLRVGHLKGNKFHLRFKKVLGIQRDKIDSTIDWIAKNGSPNYFGSQRFGVDKKNYEDGKKIVEGKLKLRDRNLKRFLISAYQSHLFNSWLSKRVELSRLMQDFSEAEVERILSFESGSLAGVKSQKSFFKLLSGDLMMHYPFGKIFWVEELESEALRFAKRDISPTGLLSGKKVKLAKALASKIEQNFIDEQIAEGGSRRYAWIFPEEIKREYIPQKAHYELSFTLPKGSYATIIVDFLRGGSS